MIIYKLHWKAPKDGCAFGNPNTIERIDDIKSLQFHIIDDINDYGVFDDWDDNGDNILYLDLDSTYDDYTGPIWNGAVIFARAYHRNQIIESLLK